MPLSRMRCADLKGIIGVLLAAAVLTACSSVKLAYNNLAEISYWWLDGYVDFNEMQTPRVRGELAQILVWHRQNELPRVVELVRRAQALAADDLTAQEVCKVADEIRDRLLAVAEYAEPAGTELALSLDDSQLKHLERKYAKINATYREEWLDRSPAKQQSKRYEQFLERSEDFYGRLDPAQRDLLREQVARSVFDPQSVDADRRQRQQEALALLRRFNAEKTPAEEARAAIHAYMQRIANPPSGPARDRQQALVQEGCRNVAALHNTASAEQRRNAVQRLAIYEGDFRQLVAVR